MKIAVGGMFQNSMKYLDRAIAQYFSLIAAAPQHQFDFIFAEGDSTDNSATWNRLNEIFPGSTFKREHKGKIYGSVDDSQRWTQIAYVVDGILERVKPEHDALLYVESDLLWEPKTLLTLLSYLDRVEAAVPMIWMRGVFYDIWAYAKDGVKFTGNPPYHRTLTQPTSNGLHEIDSGGGCLAVRGDIARKCRCIPKAKALVGFYTEMRRRGHKVWVDPKIGVLHPPL